MTLLGTMDTVKHQNRDWINHTPAAAIAAGDVVNLGGSVFGYANSGIAASIMGQVDLAPMALRRARSASATTFSVGDTVMLDVSAGLAVSPGLALDGSADYPLGICVKAKVATETEVSFIPFDVGNRNSVICPFVHEFDCDGVNGENDTDDHVLIPAWQNRHGLLILECLGLVTEAFAGTEDQGVVTISDGADNAIATLTPSDGAADAIGDWIIGTNGLAAASTGTAAKVVAAGGTVKGAVTTETTGAAAGKMKVLIRAIPLL